MKHMQEVLDEELSGESEHQKHSMHRHRPGRVLHPTHRTSCAGSSTALMLCSNGTLDTNAYLTQLH